MMPLLLMATSVRAECAKATAMRSCRPGVVVHRERTGSTTRPLGARTEARSVGLVVGGIGVILASAVAGLLLVTVGRAPCSSEVDASEPCPEGKAIAVAGGFGGAAGVVGGSLMIYFGAKDEPRRPPPPISVMRWTTQSAHGLSVAVRF
jgi:hypothetical protein